LPIAFAATTRCTICHKPLETSASGHSSLLLMRPWVDPAYHSDILFAWRLRLKGNTR
jgi:hypothetical protein